MTLGKRDGASEIKNNGVARWVRVREPARATEAAAHTAGPMHRVPMAGTATRDWLLQSMGAYPCSPIAANVSLSHSCECFWAGRRGELQSTRSLGSQITEEPDVDFEFVQVPDDTWLRFVLCLLRRKYTGDFPVGGVHDDCVPEAWQESAVARQAIIPLSPGRPPVFLRLLSAPHRPDGTGFLDTRARRTLWGAYSAAHRAIASLLRRGPRQVTAVRLLHALV